MERTQWVLKGGLPRHIRHISLFAAYMNHCNHHLVLCLVHLLKMYHELESLEKLLFLLWKLYENSLMKQPVSENAQMVDDLKTTQWVVKGGLPRHIRHISLFAVCMNHCSHHLVLCLVHLLKMYHELESLEKLLFLLWKLFENSLMKQPVPENAQMVDDLKPLKIWKACTTPWLLPMTC